MFELKSRTQIDAAIAKARLRKPRLSVVSFRSAAHGCAAEYQVAAYRVTCERVASGKRMVGCDCRAGLNGRACYHAAAAIGLHIVLASDPAHPFRLAAEAKHNVIQFPVPVRSAA